MLLRVLCVCMRLALKFCFPAFGGVVVCSGIILV